MKENNIFDGAKFGDKFLTRSGNLAIFIEYADPVYKLFIKDYDAVFCDESGRYKGYRDSNLDIVSKYQEEINEEKLEELAKSIYNSNCNDSEFLYQIQRAQINGFKTGYRKAKEE